MSPSVKILFATSPPELIAAVITRMKEILPDLPLMVVSEFQPGEGEWIPWHIARSFWENFAFFRSRLKGRRIRLAAIMLVPYARHRTMRLIPLLVAPLRLAAFNENGDHFMFRPSGLTSILRHWSWRVRELLVFESHPGGRVYTWMWRVSHPAHLRRPALYRAALAAGIVAAWRKAAQRTSGAREGSVAEPPQGITVVIPSRNGRDLLGRLLPGIIEQLDPAVSEIIVVDNGSDDGTGEYLRASFPRVLLEPNDAPLSFARAVNRGIARARFSHVCLLNNDMAIEPDFFSSLWSAFQRVPDLFCATAQVFFPPGQRREETGKAVMPAERSPFDFPISCELPIEGEDHSYVLYGSGGCSLYSTAKLRALGGAGEMYEPAYVEDLDLGYRAWQRGWPTVFVAGARVLHAHRATTSRYYSEAELERVLETNYLRFLARAVASPRLFRRLWREAIWRVNVMCVQRPDQLMEPHQMAVLAAASRAPSWVEPQRLAPGALSESLILAIGSGEVAIFPGRPARGKPVVVIVSPYASFPLSHGGAVRMYNLMRRAAADFDLVLVRFADEWTPAPKELRDICSEIVLVRRPGTHRVPSTARPDTVEEFDRPAFHAALRQTIRKWAPAIAQIEFTHMAPYAADCAGVRTILVEHDITFDLYAQLVAQNDDWETRREWEKWVRFEPDAWKHFDCVVTMSEKDRQTVQGAPVVCLPNGVDIERFRPATHPPEPARLLFIGSFAHFPNILAAEFFLREVWPKLQAFQPVLHVIAGSRHEYYLDHHRDRAYVNLHQPGIEVEDFVSDVRPAYQRAAIVIAPLVVSAGTNIKIVEAMAMGKAIVSTPAGVNGLDVSPGRDVLIVNSGEEIAQAIALLLQDPAKRQPLEREARLTAERKYDWDTIARAQAELYRNLQNQSLRATTA